MIARDASVVIALLEHRDAHHVRAARLLDEADGADLAVHAMDAAEILVAPVRTSAVDEVLGYWARMGLVVVHTDDGPPATSGSTWSARNPLAVRDRLGGMSDLKQKLRDDLTTAMKARDELTTATLRMVLAAVTAEEVSGKEARELSDDEVQAVLRREAKKRREAAEAFGGAGRTEQAEREKAEGEVVAGYLPQQLADADLTAIVAEVVAATGASGMGDMGKVMGQANARVAGRAEGGRVAAEVRRQLG